MMPIEHIQDETEYKHACKSNAYEVTRILSYMIQAKKDLVFRVDPRERNKLVKEVNHLERVIIEIQNEAQPSAPEMQF
ncbi:hypothetical protein OXE08_004517 [Salmonella enterica]|nr:hypothetical protein [Salmonella enterica]